MGGPQAAASDQGGSSCFGHFAHDAWQELKGVPFRDDHFSQADWRRHLTWKRYVPEPRILSIVVLSLAPVWLWSVVVSAAVGLYATYAQPNGAPNVTNHPTFITPFTLTSFALSLLMLFKTNSSYMRWWEARHLLGTAYIVTRSIVRLSISFVGRDHPELVPAMYRWTAAFLPSLSAYLRERPHYYQHLEGVLHPAELRWCQERGIPPIAALQVLSRLLDRACLPDIERQQMELLLNQCDTIVGGCERILRQPVSYAWNRHTQRFILVYITFLPFAFWPLFQWATLPIMAVLSFLLAGIENVGVQLEEPFRVLPLNQISAGTLRALRLMMADQQGAADMAAFSAGVSAPPPPAVTVQLGAASTGGGGGGGALEAAAKQPLAPVLTSHRRRGDPGHGGGVFAGAANGSAVAHVAAAGPTAAAVELSVPRAMSAVTTPPTARPVSPDFPDVFADGMLRG